MAKKASALPRILLLVETSLASGRDILRGVAKYVREFGPWSLYHAPRGLAEQNQDWWHDWKGDGVIARVTDEAMVKSLKKLNVPVVDVLGTVETHTFPLLHVDDAAIATLAHSHLAERGFRHFAYVGIPNQNWSDRRRESFRRASERLKCSFDEFLMESDGGKAGSWESRQEILTNWIRSLPKPVGLMVCSDQRGTDVLDACRRGEFHVPDEVAVVGVDNDEPLCLVCDPPLSSVSANHERVGFQAAGYLAGLLRKEARPLGADFGLVPPATVETRHSSDILAVADKVVSAALHLIRQNLSNMPGIDEMAATCGVSRSTLQRRFHDVLGSTIHDQIISARLKEAQKLICTTPLPLATIAKRTGFQHAEYMGAVFRQRVGRSPSQYRL
jgi:LacI family transcriptional regulator